MLTKVETGLLAMYWIYKNSRNGRGQWRKMYGNSGKREQSGHRYILTRVNAERFRLDVLFWVLTNVRLTIMAAEEDQTYLSKSE